MSLLSFGSYSALANEHGPSFFIFDDVRLRSNYKSLRSAFLSSYHKVEIGYSYKTNYTPRLCQILHEEGAWAEVVSEMEYAATRRLDIPQGRVIFNGPYKADWAFREAAIGGATVNLDSKRDLDLLSAVAGSARESVLIRVALRVNFAINTSISRFGFDVDCYEFTEALKLIKSFRNVRLVGLHCHFPDRDLDSFRKRAEMLVELCDRVFFDCPPDVLNIGGGFFSLLPPSLSRTIAEAPVTFADYASVVGHVLSQAFPDPCNSPTLFLEPGTALVADTFTFYTQVVSVKSIRGRNFATVSGSIFDISPNAKIRSLPVTPIYRPQVLREDARDFSIVGFTCIEADILTDNLTAPLCPGDVLAYGNVGSYSVVMRPPFILPSNPVLVASATNSGYDVIKARQSNAAVFDLFL
jgi:diaminopimelate decarboxylase